MLDVIRETTTGWIAKFILGLLFVSFTVWGIGVYNESSVNLEVASVAGEGISQQTWRTNYGRFLSSQRESLGRSLQESEKQLVRESALQGMIDTAVIGHIVADLGLRVSDKVLGGVIASMEHFQEEGLGFDRELYNRSVVAQGMAPAFESEMRMNLLSDQLQRALAGSAFVLEQEVQRIIRIREQRRDISYLTFAASDFRDQVQQEQSDIEQWYQDHSEQYLQPEQLRIAYLDLQLEALLPEVDVTDDDLRLYYADNRQQFDEPETRSIEQLIARIPEKEVTEEQLAAAREQLAAVIEPVQEGQDFQAIIESLQEEEEQADIDFIEQLAVTRGSLPVAIDDFIFTAEVGQHSDLLETEQGIHIVKVLGIQGGEEYNTFANRRDEVEEVYRRRQAQTLFADRVEQLINTAYEHQDGLEAAALETGLPVQESGFFSNSGADEGIASHPPVVAAAFSEALKAGQSNSDGIDLSDERMVVLRVLEVQPSRIRPLDDVREMLIEDFITERSAGLARTRGEEILQALRTGQDRQLLTEEHLLQWTDKTDVTRDDLELSRQLLRAAFSVGRPDEGARLYEGVQDSDGDYWLLEISAVRDSAGDEVQDETRETARAEMLDKTSFSEWQYFMEDARRQVDVEIYEDNL